MTFSEIATLSAIIILSISLGVRLLPGAGGAYRPLLRLQMLVLAILIFSMPVLYIPLDRLMGGQNYLNLLLHLVFIYASWKYGVIVAEPFMDGGRRPWCLKSWVPVVAILGATVSFLSLDADFTSRGVDAFMNDPAWSFYWIFNIMGAWVPAIAILPWLIGTLKVISVNALRWAYRFMILGYAFSILSVFGYIISYFDDSWIPVREALVIVAQFGIIAALVIIPLSSVEKKYKNNRQNNSQQIT